MCAVRIIQKRFPVGAHGAHCRGLKNWYTILIFAIFYNNIPKLKQKTHAKETMTMNIVKTASVLFLCLTIFHVSAYAKSPVWKISKDGNHLFVGGTIHVLSSADYPLPDAFDAAFKNSAVLVLEADLQKMKTPEVQKAFVEASMYTGGENITQFLLPNTVQELEAYLKSRGIQLEKLSKFKPGLLSITLLMLELQRLGLTGTGVDEFYNVKALHENRDITFLETIPEQITFIAKMGEGEENEFIEYTLQDMNDLPTILQALKDAWRNGDNAQLQKLALDQLEKEFPKIYTSLLVDRNNNWIPLIETMMKTKDVELILVGSFHLVGDNGVLTQLQKRGYTVENVY